MRSRHFLAALALLGALSPTTAARGTGKPAAKAVAEQKELAQTYWKRLFPSTPFEHHETQHLLVCGNAGKGFKEAATALERTYTLAAKALELGKEITWPGKLTVYLIADRRDFRAAVRGIERRLPEAEERGTFVIRSDTPHVIAGPPAEGLDLSVEGQAAAQIGAALLRAKQGATPPEWLSEGFGRAIAYHSGAQRDQAAERRRAAALALQGRKAAREAWGNNLKADEAPVLRASLIEYLAFSGRVKIFVPFLRALRPQEERPNPTPEMALAVVNVSQERLNDAWQKWLRAAK
jgi:hypothetical protein